MRYLLKGQTGMPMYHLIHVGYRGPEKFPDFEFQGG